MTISDDFLTFLCYTVLNKGGWYSMSKENAAVFIGHNECYGVTSEQIKEAIVSLIDKGVTEFLSGGQGGFDRLCGRCVYELKQLPHYSLSVIQCV